MDLVVLANPRSGRGVAVRLAADLRAQARRRGHRGKILEVGGPETLDAGKLADASALAIIGGDGTVHRSAGAAIEAQTPVYHLPTGNENLFARALGMRRSPAAMLDAMESEHTAMADVGTIAGQPFLIMASLGPDASVIRRLAHSRRRAIGHLAYAEPIARELVHTAIPTLSVAVDGRAVVQRERGVLVIANTRQYAARLDPCAAASLFSGRLHVAFMPARHVFDVLRWGGRAWRRRIGPDVGATLDTGAAVSVRAASENAPVQVDGEHFSPDAPGKNGVVVELGIRERALPVLVSPAQQRAKNREIGVSEPARLTL